ncbi:MAG: CRISPR-associated endonuclease Cas1 [Herpetosiphon sp.]|nr:CRISPR-associated endonuclease Cas1 [Herpetosiphon sp.]
MTTLYVLEQGAELHCDGERLRVMLDEQERGSCPLTKLEDILVFGNVGITTPAMKRLLDRGIEVTFLTTQGRYHGRLVGHVTAHVALRRQQYRRADDHAWSLAFAQTCVEAKLRNARVVLQRYARNRTSVDAALTAAIATLQEFIERTARTTQISSLLGVEGSGTACYFGGFRTLFASEWEFNNRNRRPPTDPINVMLSLGYTMLVHKAVGAVEATGLDPYQGFLHQVDYNRPSLVLDLIEEFRPFLVDALVMRCCADGIITPADFVRDAAAQYPILLTDEGKRRFVAAFEERMRSEALHPDGADGRPGKVSYWRCLELQARRMVRAIQHGVAYEPWLIR